MTYLVHMDKPTITADDIRPLIGLAATYLDPVIEVGISYISAMSRAPVCRQVWAVAEGENPGRIGTPVAVGDLYQLPADNTDRRWFRNYTYEADARAVDVARQRIVAWCLSQGDILDALGAERLAAVDTAAAAIVEGRAA